MKKLLAAFLIALLLLAAPLSAATKFMATPDATQGTEFWSTVTGTITYDTTVLQSGLASWKADSGAGNAAAYLSKIGVLADAGRRITGYFKFVNLPGSTVAFISTGQPGSDPLTLQISSVGILSVVSGGGAIIATGGTTLVAGTVYRIALSYTITSVSSYSVKVYLNAALEISASNSPMLDFTGTNDLSIGWLAAPGANKVLNFSHVYLDDGTDLADPGDVRVTAKLPNTVNTAGFDTTTGTGAVNERPISTANLKRHNATGQATQDYTLQTASAGDVDISSYTLISRTAWIWADATTASSGTPGIVDNGATTGVTLTTSPALYTLITDSASYPSNAAGIGMRSTGTTADTRLYECGTLIAYLVPASAGCSGHLAMMGVGC